MPIHYGRVLELEGRVVHVGRSSLDVEIKAYLEPVEEGGERVLAADAVFVYVSISETGRPFPFGGIWKEKNHDSLLYRDWQFLFYCLPNWQHP